jgi:hypothetical protein
MVNKLIKAPKDPFSIENYGLLGLLLRFLIFFIVSVLVSATEFARKDSRDLTYFKKLFDAICRKDILDIPLKITILVILIYGSYWLIVKIRRA